jgi:type IV pilus assembly protein PilV
MNMSVLKQSRGAGLIEVLITMLILASTLLALAALQMRSLQYNQGAYFRSQANISAYDILDRIRVNKQNIGDYSVALSTFSGTVATTPLATADISQWQRDIDANLPAAKSGITCSSATSFCTVTIQWNEINSSGVSGNGEDISKFEYTAKL